MKKKKLVLTKAHSCSNYTVSKAYNLVEPQVGSALTEAQVKELIAFDEVDIEIVSKD